MKHPAKSLYWCQSKICVILWQKFNKYYIYICITFDADTLDLKIEIIGLVKMRTKRKERNNGTNHYKKKPNLSRQHDRHTKSIVRCRQSSCAQSNVSQKKKRKKKPDSFAQKTLIEQCARVYNFPKWEASLPETQNDGMNKTEKYSTWKRAHFNVTMQKAQRIYLIT